MTVVLDHGLSLDLLPVSVMASEVDSAAGEFAVGPGALLVLIAVAVVLTAAIGRALLVLLALLRQVLATLGLMVAGLGLVLALGYGAVTGGGSAAEPSPAEPVPTVAPPHGPAPGPANGPKRGPTAAPSSMGTIPPIAKPTR